MNKISITIIGAILMAGCGQDGGGDFGGGDHLPPSAQLWTETPHGTLATFFQFFGEGSDPNGGVVTFAWDFDGDGVTDSTLQSPTHTFATEGDKTVALTVMDDVGKTSKAQMVVTVFATPSNTVPNVFVRAFTLNGSRPFEVFFRADALDPDLGGLITNYDWDFDGNGTTDSSGPSSTATFLFPQSGAFTAKVTATDLAGAQSSATVVLALCPSGHKPDTAPAAMILSDSALIGPAPLSVNLMAFGSDMDGGSSSAAWSWDADGDGNLESLGSGRTITISGLAAGLHRIRLDMFDDEGRTPSTAEIIVVATGNGETAPAAWAFADAITASPQAPIQFHGRALDPNGDLLTFSWDFDGDGTEDSTLPDPIFAYALPGFYIPRLIVSDGINQSIADLSVVIRGCPGDGPNPGPYFWYDCKDLTIFHGTSGKLILDPVVSIGGSFARSYQLMGKAGPMGLFGDPAAGEIRVTDAKGGQAPPDVFGAPAPPDAVKNTTATINTITVTSLESSCGRLFPTQYTVRIRLVDPGVRVQILKATVYVLHDCDPVF